MNQETFDRIVDERCRLIKSVLASKAEEYARGDRLHNFKRAAGFMGKEPETACWGFAMKHFTSVADIVDDVELHGCMDMAAQNMAKEKLGDAINYLILLEALLEERVISPVVGVAIGNSKGNTVKVRLSGAQPKRRSK